MNKLILGMAVVAMTVISCNDTAKKNESQQTGDEANNMALGGTYSDMNKKDSTAVAMTDKSVADIAMENDDFSTLEKAVQAAGLEETLQGEGPFTIFAPTNDAFNQLPEGTVDDLLLPENKEKLGNILKYHVVSGEFKADDVVKAIKNNNDKFGINTIQGETLSATLDGNDVILTDSSGNKSKVVMKDVEASNGVIHAIDAVLMPKK
tara:strand:- start:1550 stop:2170 length:621 start_codon:yes stop_codon:yes gene_type:complete